MRQSADHSPPWHHPSSPRCAHKLMLPDAGCDFREVREDVAKAEPEATGGIWAVSRGPFVHFDLGDAGH